MSPHDALVFIGGLYLIYGAMAAVVLAVVAIRRLIRALRTRAPRPTVTPAAARSDESGRHRRPTQENHQS
jgi:hypothetical protein